MALMKQQRLIEQAEVQISNLIALSDSHNDEFVISHLDVMITLRTALVLLQEAQDAIFNERLIIDDLISAHVS